jgi:hypothetical protein
MIQNLVALGNCLKSGSNRGADTELDCAVVAVGCTSSGGTGILTEHTGSYDYVHVRRVPLPLPVARDISATLAHRSAITAPSLEPLWAYFWTRRLFLD